MVEVVELVWVVWSKRSQVPPPTPPGRVPPYDHAGLRLGKNKDCWNVSNTSSLKEILQCCLTLQTPQRPFFARFHFSFVRSQNAYKNSKASNVGLELSQLTTLILIRNSI